MVFEKHSRKVIIWMFTFLVFVLMIIPSQAQPYAEVEYLNIDVKINDGYAITTVEEKLDNMNNFSITDNFEILIPEKAFMSGFSITIDGEEYQADILKKEEAQQKFEEAKSSGRTAGILETRDTELFSYSLNFEANQSIVVKLSYEQAISRTMGEYEYLQYLRSNRDINDLSVIVNINSSTDVLSVETPNFRSDIIYPDTNSAKIKYTSSSLPGQDLKIVFKTENTPLNGKMLFYENDGKAYFMHIFSPTAQDIGSSPLNKDIIFVIDKSGSMSGMKMQQVQDAFTEIINDLPEEDRFNVVFFDNDIRPHSNEILLANQVNKDKALATVLNTNAGGSTNINDALVTSLDMFYNESDNVPIIVFLTDGQPTAGVMSTAIIRENVLNANKVNASIFSIAFGEEYDYDFNFLQALSFENRGIAVYFEADTEASEGISNFYETISTPLVSDLIFSYDEKTSNIVITGKDHLYVGSELIILGNYEQNSESITSRVNGNTRSGKHTFEREFLVETAENNDFISRLWAYNNIINKLDRMKVVGETDQLVSDVTNVSLEYGFVTPYTSFFVEVPQPKKDEELKYLEETEEVEELEYLEETEEVEELGYLEETFEETEEVEEQPGFGIVLGIVGLIAAISLRKNKRKGF